MRQLKDASIVSNSIVKLLYRVRRKHSGYVWIEAIGKLHIEPGKGRKCVIAIARPRDVMQMNWNELRQAGGLGDTEFFAKLDLRGTILTATQGTASVLGYPSQELSEYRLDSLCFRYLRANTWLLLQSVRLSSILRCRSIARAWKSRCNKLNSVLRLRSATKSALAAA